MNRRIHADWCRLPHLRPPPPPRPCPWSFALAVLPCRPSLSTICPRRCGHGRQRAPPFSVLDVVLPVYPCPSGGGVTGSGGGGVPTWAGHLPSTARFGRFVAWTRRPLPRKRLEPARPAGARPSVPPRCGNVSIIAYVQEEDLGGGRGTRAVAGGREVERRAVWTPPPSVHAMTTKSWERKTRCWRLRPSVRPPPPGRAGAPGPAPKKKQHAHTAGRAPAPARRSSPPWVTTAEREERDRVCHGPRGGGLHLTRRHAPATSLMPVQEPAAHIGGRCAARRGRGEDGGRTGSANPSRGGVAVSRRQPSPAGSCAPQLVSAPASPARHTPRPPLTQWRCGVARHPPPRFPRPPLSHPLPASSRFFPPLCSQARTTGAIT